MISLNPSIIMPLMAAAISAVGQISMKYAMLKHGQIEMAPNGIISLLLQPPLIFAMAIYAIAPFMWLQVLSKTPLSTAYPRKKESVQTISITSLSSLSFAHPTNFVNALDKAEVTVAVINPFLIPNHPDLQNCTSIRNAFLANGWEQLSYLVRENGQCIAAYVKEKNK